MILEHFASGQLTFDKTCTQTITFLLVGTALILGGFFYINLVGSPDETAVGGRGVRVEEMWFPFSSFSACLAVGASLDLRLHAPSSGYLTSYNTARVIAGQHTSSWFLGVPWTETFPFTWEAPV